MGIHNDPWPLGPVIKWMLVDLMLVTIHGCGNLGGVPVGLGLLQILDEPLSLHQDNVSLVIVDVVHGEGDEVDQAHVPAVPHVPILLGHSQHTAEGNAAQG
jgi:hypothetical protein